MKQSYKKLARKTLRLAIALLALSPFGVSASAIETSSGTKLKVMYEVYPTSGAPTSGECVDCFENKGVYEFTYGQPIKIDVDGVEAEIKLIQAENGGDLISAVFTKGNDVVWGIQPTSFNGENRDFKTSSEEFSAFPSAGLKKISIRVRNTNVPY